jgi:hypothetical protein
MANTKPLPLFYSLNRFLEHDDHTGAGSVEICRATFDLGVIDGKSSEPAKITAEGKLDTCGSVCLSHSLHLQQIKDCRKYGLREVVLWWFWLGFPKNSLF